MSLIGTAVEHQYSLLKEYLLREDLSRVIEQLVSTDIVVGHIYLGISAV